MRAVILEQINALLTVGEVEPLPLGKHDVRVETGATGVCHSDVNYIRGRHPIATPVVLGHEGAGRVVEVGPSVTAVRTGDRVIASWASFCARCYQCVRGRGHLCEAQASIATQPRATWAGQQIAAMTGLGTMAETMTVNEANLVKVETDLPDEQLALIGCCVTTGVGAALWTARVEPGTSVAVFGCGGVGQATVQGASIAGAETIIAIDPVPLKRDEALRNGATDFVDPAVSDPVEAIRALTSGRGVEYAFDAAGLVETMRHAYDATCPGGTVTFVGAPSADLELALPANELRSKGKRIFGSHYGSAQIRRDMPRLVRLAETGRLDIGGMVTRRGPLEAVNGAIEAIESGEVVRYILLPS